MEDGNPRSNEVPDVNDLTQEEIWHLLDAATDYKIKREADAESEEGADEQPAEAHDAAPVTEVSDTVRILSDLLTIQEHFGYLKEIAFRYLGDANGERATSWQQVCDKMGMEYLTDGEAPEFPEDVTESDVTAIAMETDADEQQIFLCELPATSDTVQAVSYAMTHAEPAEEEADEA